VLDGLPSAMEPLAEEGAAMVDPILTYAARLSDVTNS